MITVPKPSWRPGLFIIAVIAVAAGLASRVNRHPEDRSSQSAPRDAADGWTGKAAPEFTLDTLEGRRVSLSGLRGKVVLLNFWATWCAPCRVEMPWLVDFYARYQPLGLEIVGVSVDDAGRDEVAAFVRAHRVNYPIVLSDEAVTKAYGGARFLPQTFFIDRAGKFIEQTYGVRTKDDFETEVRRALGLKGPTI